MRKLRGWAFSLLAIVGLVALSGSIRAQAPSCPPEAPSTAQWIKQLQDPSATNRREAAERLAKSEGDEIGPAVRERLAVEQDAEVRSALLYVQASHGDALACSQLMESLSRREPFTTHYLAQISGGILNEDQQRWRHWLWNSSAPDFQALTARTRLPEKIRQAGKDEFWEALGFLYSEKAMAFLYPLGDLPVVSERFLAVAVQFPNSDYGREANELSSWLERQRQEWAEFEAATRVPADRQSPLERADELVFLLRTENRLLELGAVFLVHPVGQKGPATQLALMVFDAVPSLIDALDDRSPTRSVIHSYRLQARPPELMRINDVAIRILERIAGREFERHSVALGIDYGALRRDVEQWWRKARSEGEEAYLARITKQGTFESRLIAELLVARFPDSADVALREGMKNSQDHHIRDRFRELLDGAQRKRVGSELHDQASHRSANQ